MTTLSLRPLYMCSGRHHVPLTPTGIARTNRVQTWAVPSGVLEGTEAWSLGDLV